MFSCTKMFCCVQFSFMIYRIHKCTTQQFFSPPTQEIIEMFRKEIFEKKNIVNSPNPAYFLYVKKLKA